MVNELSLFGGGVIPNTDFGLDISGEFPLEFSAGKFVSSSFVTIVLFLCLGVDNPPSSFDSMHNSVVGLVVFNICDVDDECFNLISFLFLLLEDGLTSIGGSSGSSVLSSFMLFVVVVVSVCDSSFLCFFSFLSFLFTECFFGDVIGVDPLEEGNCVSEFVGLKGGSICSNTFTASCKK